MTSPQKSPINLTGDDDLFISQQNYEAKSSDEINLKKGDIVQVVDTVDSNVPKKPKLDPELDEVSQSGNGILDTSAARHKLAVKPKRKYRDTRQTNININTRWKVRIISESETPQEGWVPTLLLRPADEPTSSGGVQSPPPDTSYRRDAVIRELIDTEEEFCSDLRNVLEKYYFPLASDAKLGNARPPKCVRDNHELIFGNLKQISEFHNTVLMEGVKYYASEPIMIGRVFLRLERDFDKHVNYCRDEPLAQHFLQNNLEAKDYFMEVSQRLGDDKTLSEHLKLPIQRINDYQLLLKELVKYTLWLQENASYLQRALELMLSVPHRATDDKFTSSIEGFRGSIYKLGRLLAHDWYSITKSSTENTPVAVKKERYLFLFKARILVCKVKRISEDRSVFQLKDIIKLPDVEVRDFPNDPRTFELHQANIPGYPLTLTAHRDLVKLYWLDEIRQYSSDIVALEEHAADDLQVEKIEEPIEQKEPTQITTTVTTSTESFKTAEGDVTVTEALETSLQDTVLSEAQTVIVEAKRAIVIPVVEPLKAEIHTEATTELKEVKTEIASSSTVEIKVLSTETKEIFIEKSSKKESEVKSSVAISECKSATTSNSLITSQEKLSQSTLTSGTEVIKSVTENSVNKSESTKKETLDKVEQLNPIIPVENPLKTEESETKKSSNTAEQQNPSKPEQNPVNKSETLDKVEQLNPIKPVANPSNTVESETKESSSTAEQQNPSKPEQNPVNKPESEKIEDSDKVKQQNPIKPEQISVNKPEPTDKPDEQNPVNKSESNKQDLSDKVEQQNTTKQEENPKSKTESDTQKSSDKVESQNPSKSEETPANKTESDSKETADKVEQLNSATAEQHSSNDNIQDSGEDLEMSRRYGSFKSSSTRSEYREEISASYSSSSTNGRQGISEVHQSAAISSSSEIQQDGALISSERSGYAIQGSELREGGIVISSDQTVTIDSGSGLRGRPQLTSGTNGSSVEISEIISETKASKTEASSAEISSAVKIESNTSKSSEIKGKPTFTQTIQGCNIEPGDNAEFKCKLGGGRTDSLTWLKENKPLDDKLADRVVASASEEGDAFTLKIMHCLESDSGIYTALALNADGKATCTAQLLVEQLTPEQRRERVEANAPVFLVKLKDTELLEDTYLRFMIKVKGDPKPNLTFFKDDKEILDGNKNVKIIRDHADSGFYEMVIEKVKYEDAGLYRCIAENKFGEVTSQAQVRVTDHKNIFGELEKEGLLAPGVTPKFMWQRNGIYFEPDERFKVLLGEDEDSLALVFQHVKPEDAGLYTCVAQTSSGLVSCSAELTVQGAVNQLPKEPEKPKIIIEQRTVESSAGGSAMLDLQITGYPRPLVTWTYDGKPIEAGGKYKFLYEDTQSYSLVIKNVTAADAGKYEVKAKNDLGIDTGELELNIKAPPKFKSKIEDNSCLAEETLRIKMEIEGSPKPSIKIYRDGQEVKLSERIQIESEGTSYTLIIKETKLSDSGSYSIVASNELSQASEFWKTKVHSPPKIIKKLGENKVCSESENVSFEIKVESDPAPTISWYKNDKEITSDTTTVVRTSDGNGTYGLKITGTVTTDSGRYKCVLKNEHGKTEDSARLDIRSAPIVREKLQNITVTEGDTNIELTASVDGFPKPNGKWFLGDVEITESRNEFEKSVDEDGNYKLRIKEANSDLSGQYTLKLTNELGAAENSAELTVNCKPKLKKTLTDTVVDEGASLNLQIEVVACPEPEVRWYKDGADVSADARIKITRDTHRKETYNLTVDLVKYEDGGEYEVIVQNVLGSVSSKSTVTVHKIVDSTNNGHEEEEITSRKTDDSIIAYPIIDNKVGQGEIAEQSNTIEIIRESQSIDVPDAEKPDETVLKKSKKPKLLAHVTTEEIEPSQKTEEHQIDEEILKPKTEEIYDETSKPKIARLISKTSIEKIEVLEQKVDKTDKGPNKPKTARLLSKSSIENVETVEQKEIIIENLEEPQKSKLLSKSKIDIKESVESIKAEMAVDDVITIKTEFKRSDSEKSGIQIVELEEPITPTTENINPPTNKATVDDDNDEEMNTLFKKIKKQRSVLEEIIGDKTKEPEEASPRILDTNLEDGSVFETQTQKYYVKASGVPTPEAEWLYNGEPIKSTKTTKIIREELTYTLEIPKMKKAKHQGKYECKLKNRMGEITKAANLTVLDETDLRRPKVRQGLSDVQVPKNESATMTAVITGDPEPYATWYYKSKELKKTEVISFLTDVRDIEDGLKECTFSLNISDSLHQNTGEYTVTATNQHGECDSSARLDVLLKPELYDLYDVSGVPGDSAELTVTVHSNPEPIVTWSKDDVEITASESYRIEKSKEKEQYKLIISKVNLADEGKYTINASNNLGEATGTLSLNTQTQTPSIITKLTDQTIDDTASATLHVRCDGLPKPAVTWLHDGKTIENNEHTTIETKVEAQVTSDLIINNFNNEDSGKYTCVAKNLIGEAETNCRVGLAQTPPSFGKKLDKSVEVFEGKPFELKTTIAGSPKPTVNWYKDGEPIKDNKHIKTDILPDGTIKLRVEKATPDDSGAYKVVVSNPNGQIASLCAVVVNPEPLAPEFVKELENVSVPAGQPLKLEAKVNAYPPPKIEWTKDGVPIRASQGFNVIKLPDGTVGLETDSSKPDQAGVYSLTASNKLGEVTGEATVEILPESTKPSFSGELIPMKVVEGFPAKLEVKILGHPKPTVKWTRNGVEIIPDGRHIKITESPDGTCAVLIDKCTPHDSGPYEIILSNENGDTSNKANLTVVGRKNNDTPEERPFFLHNLRDVITDEGTPLIIEAPFRGNPIPTVSWSKDGTPIEPDARTLITCDGARVGLVINDATPSDAGVYSCNLTNPLGEDTKDAKAIVRKIYQPPNFIQKFTDLQQLPTFDAKFPCRISGVPYPEVTWYKDNKPIHETDKYHIKRDGDASCLYVRNCAPEDEGRYKCTATNKEGTASCESTLQVVDKIDTRQKIEAPTFLKKIGDTELYKGMTAKFTACATGFPEPEVEWQREGVKLFPSERIRMEKDRSGLLRLSIEAIDTPDVGKYTCRIFNEHGSDECHANLTFDSIDIRPKRPVGDQYLDFDKHRNTGVPVPLSDAPIISKMTDRHLTLSWKPSLPSGPRFPVTYQVEMLDLPNGDWKTVRTGVRSCVCGIPHLEPFKDYKFRVRVENQFGISDPSPFAVTYRQKLEPEPPKFTPYLPPGSQFSLERSQYFPKDFDIERPLHGNMSQAPVFLRQEDDRQYGVKNHNVNLFWFVYGYPKPKISYTFDDDDIEMGGRFDSSYTRNGQASLFINKMLERDVGVYEAIAKNEHGEARQRVRLEIAEPPRFYRRLDEQHVLLRKGVRLEAKVTGVPYPELKWYKDWQPLASSSRIKIQFLEPDTCILTINDVIARDEGLYSLSARNVAGTASSSAMIYISDNEVDYNYYNYSPHINAIKPRIKPYEEMYDLGDELGRGTQGVTYHAVERLTGRNYAAKIMHGRSDLKPFMFNELEIMNSLNHRKLIRLYDAFDRDSFMMLVTELASGGELVKDNLLKQSYYTESEIAGYIRQILYGLDYMHDKNIGHFGLNIGDLLISHPGSDDLKICDFGLSRRITMGRLAPLHYGVPEYVSPETARGEGVGLGTDMWSLGIITYILLSGISPFRGKDDRETLNKVRDGSWVFTDDWWINISSEAKDFIRSLLVITAEGRLDVKSALKHPWLTRADKAPANEYQISTDRLRNYYNLYREWYDNASCRTWYRRNKLTVADSDPSRMVYPPGESYTPTSRTPERIPRKPGSWETRIPERPGLDYEIGVIKSESHYQNGPDTYLLQLRDTDFPVRLREYMKVAATVRPGRTLGDSDYDWRTPSIHERRRFTDVMDEEIDDERKERISKYGSADTYSLRRLRHELGYRLDTYAEAEALIESKQSGSLPFFREKQQIVPIVQGQDAELVCFAVGDPTPVVQFFKNDTIIGENNRIKLTTDEDGRSILKLCPALEFDIGLYKIVARNKVGQTFTRTRVVLGTTPDSPDSPTAAQVSDTEVLLTWRQPKHDGYSPVLCYSLQYKLCDDVEWTQCADNIDHEFYLIKDLQPEKNYIYRLAARNSVGWGEFGVTTAVVKTKASGAPKIQLSRAMTHLQQLTDSGHPIVIEEKTKLDYSIEKNPIEWDTTTNVSDQYNFISEISRGRFSVVVKAVNKSNDSVCSAKLLECKTETVEQTQQEWDAWRSLRHERIVSLLAGFRKPESPIAALITERLQGADVLTYLSLRHEYSEQTVATIISQVIDGLQYLHWRGFGHLNIQPDNVVLSTVRSVQVKLVDFGSVQKVSKLGSTVSKIDSHPEYTSPEVLSEEPAFPQTDIWSVGVLTYVLLSGTSPFRGKDVEETRQNILYARYRFEHLYKELSQEAVRFIMLIFKRNPNKRPTAEECHENRWFMPTDFMIKKRERAVFLGNRLKEYNEEYHNEKSEAAQSTSLTSISGAKGPLGRSNSIQEEILTAP